MGEYVAERDDWDVATLALSINMANQEFPVEEFAERAEAYRETLRGIVADTDHPDISVVEGRELTDVSGYTADILHLGDAGMETIGRNLARELDERVE